MHFFSIDSPFKPIKFKNRVDMAGYYLLTYGDFKA